MAEQGSIPGEALVFKVEDPANPGTYLAQCTINTERKLDITPDLFQGWLSDCDDPSAPNTPIRRVKGVDITFTGAGTADPASAKALMKLALDGAVFSGKLIQDIETNGWTITATWVLQMSLGGMKNELQTFDCTVSIASKATVSYDGE